MTHLEAVEDPASFADQGLDRVATPPKGTEAVKTA
jgi:hypothetical protein